MKRVLMMLLVAMFVAGANSLLIAGNGDGPGDGTGVGPCVCETPIDSDGDGYCDICEGCIPVGDGPFGPKGPNGDGSGSNLAQYDGPGDGTGIGPCICGETIDENGDGYCDVCGGCIPVGDGPHGPKGPNK